EPLFGAIIIGLGQLGTLTPAQLQASMRYGVLSYIRHLHDNGFDADHEVGISCLLVGSGSGGISMEDALTALLRGAQDANASLAAQKGFTPLRLQAIEFVELFLDRAVQAAKVLAKLCHNIEFHNGINLAAGIRETRGGRERIVWSEGDDWWERLRISQGKHGALNFVYLTQRARAEARLVQTQRQLIDRFIERATTTTRNDAEVATTLFELLVPNEFKHQAPHRDDTLLILDRTAARYPWELLQQHSPGGSARPVAVEAGLIRQLVVNRFRRNPAPPDLSEALVIGDPKSEFTELPGAQQEAERVITLLSRDGYDTRRSLLRSNAERVIAALYARPYRILHLAGHGVYDYRDPSNGAGDLVSGMVLGNGMFLTAAEISQMPVMPDLVFINCCHLGRDRAPEDGFETGLRPNLLAASLATQLIQEGARCVIAAGWAVDDRAALRFAEVFYQRMVADNARFGSAVLDARRAVFRDQPDSNTWGAYQCYGDPNFRLRASTTGGSGNRMAPEFTIPREMTLYLNDLRQRAASAAGENIEALKDELQRLLRQIP
ncbi:MAG TPA: CHAT domain-containing protein, partial [Chromatiales bacterium]|nr:CHAT domain-containing protein [Chromatiales bacterium]